MKILNFYDFIKEIWQEIEIIYSTKVDKAFTDGYKRIYLNSEFKKEENKDIKKFVILHELAHIYLNYLNGQILEKQPKISKENEVICDILATIYLKKISKWEGKRIIRCLTILYPSSVALFRIHIIRNILLKEVDNEVVDFDYSTSYTS
ncbi:MAG: hypothetical protein ABIL47_07965 [candidate division WOR-3 bacterium]